MSKVEQFLSGMSKVGEYVSNQFYFNKLKDTPTGYLGHSGDYLVVNDGESGIHFTGIEKIANDLTNYGFGGGSSDIPKYTNLPDPTENDGKIVASGCDLYYGCDSEWKKIGADAIPPPENIPGCISNLQEYNQYQEYKDSIVNNTMSSAFDSALSQAKIKENFFNDVCLFKQVNMSTSETTNRHSIAAGYYHSVYLKSDGTVWAAGRNQYGELGDGTTTQRDNPVQVKNSDGSAFSGVVGIAAGHYHTVYLKSDGTVWAAGRNTNGQLGDGSTTQRNNPVQVKNSDGSALSGVVGIAAGSYHTAYLKDDGTVWAVGYNDQGQLGDGTKTERRNPVQVKNSDGSAFSGVVGIAAGHYHTVYLKSDGTVWGTGGSTEGELGTSETSSTSVGDTFRLNPVQEKDTDGSELKDVLRISANSAYTLYLKSDGTVFSRRVKTTNNDGSEFNGVVGIAIGPAYAMFLKSDGTVWATGINNYGQLGDGTTQNRHSELITVNISNIKVNQPTEPLEISIKPSVKIIQSGYAWGIFETDTVIDIEAINGSCTFVEWRSSNSSLQDYLSSTTTAIINADTSITGVFSC